MLPAIPLSVSDRTCCARQVSLPFPFPKITWLSEPGILPVGHRTSCVSDAAGDMPLLKIQQARRPLSPQTRCRGYHYNCERKG